MNPPPITISNSDDEDIAATAKDVEAVVLCLVDHPAVSAATIRELAECFRQSHAPLVIPTYQNQRGHPVIIARALFEELLALGPAEAANSVIRRHYPAAQLLAVPDREVLVDVDNPESYREIAGQ